LDAFGHLVQLFKDQEKRALKSEAMGHADRLPQKTEWTLGLSVYSYSSCTYLYLITADLSFVIVKLFKIF